MTSRRRRWTPWWIGFGLACLACAIAVVALGSAVVVAVGERRAVVPFVGTDITPGRTPGLVVYAGALPRAVPGVNLVEDDGEGVPPDLFFAPAAEGVPVDYFVPVAPLAAGLPALTSLQLQRLIDGAVTAASLGGRGATATTAALRKDVDSLARFGFVSVATTFESPEALAAAFARADAAPAIAFVRIGDLRPGMDVLIVDGLDAYRGIASPERWPWLERVDVRALTASGDRVLAQVRAGIQAQPVETVRLSATGDILLSRCTYSKIVALGDWRAPLAGPVGQFLAGSDIALGSLDGSIQDIGTPFGCVETTNLTSPPEAVETLLSGGIDGVTVATNHSLDCGTALCRGSRALLRTLQLLDSAGIKHVGGGADLEAALAPAIFEVHGLRIGVIGFDDIAAEELQAGPAEPGTAPLDDSYEDERASLPREPAFYKPAGMLALERFTARIRELKGRVDIVVVQVQSGTEDTHDASPRSIKALRAATDAGADIVVGNQAHWVQGVEVRGGAWVSYALGNFIFDQRWTPEHTQGYVLEAVFMGKRFVGVRLHPYVIVDQYRPEFLHGATRTKVLDDVFGASTRLP